MSRIGLYGSAPSQCVYTTLYITHTLHRLSLKNKLLTHSKYWIYQVRNIGFIKYKTDCHINTACESQNREEIVYCEATQRTE